MNNQRFIQDFQLLDKKYSPSQFYIQSTGVDRVIQSAYSELVGMYNPSENNQNLSEGEMKSLESRKGMPPLKIRMEKELNRNLGQKAIIDGFVQAPVYAYAEPTIKDEITY